MAGALTNFPFAGSETRNFFTLTINGQLNISRNTKNSVKMAFSTVNAPALIMRKFSGLRVSNALDGALKPQVDFDSRIASKIYFRQSKPTELFAKPRFADFRFTEKAYKSLQYSQKEARRLGHDEIDIDDVLLGLIAQRSGIGAKVLNAMGITLEDARVAAKKIVKWRFPVIFEELSYSCFVYTLFEEAKYLACDYIGPEHLLLAITSKHNLVANKVLEILKVDPSKIRQEVIRIVGEMPTLENWSTNLIKLAGEDELDPVIGREIEVQRVIEILDQHTKNNPWLIGECGVGKTTIVNGLALRIADNLVPKTLVGKKVIRLDMSQLVDGADSYGEFEERIKKLMEEIRQNDNIILFIDELEISIEAAKGTVDAKNILKLALAKGDLQCIVATTLDVYKRHIENDPALERRFQTVEVLEPSVEEAIQILRGLREVYEIDNEVRYTDDALVAAVELSNQHFRDAILPDKAIHLIKWAGKWVLFKASRLSQEARCFEEDRRRLIRDKNEASLWGTIHIRDLDLLTAIISKCKEMSKAGLKEGGLTVTVADVSDVVSYWTVPREKVFGEEAFVADSGEGSSKSTMPTLEGCFKELMNIIMKEGISRLEDIYE